MREALSKWWDGWCDRWRGHGGPFFGCLLALILYGLFGFMAWSCLNPSPAPDPVAESTEAAIGWWTSSWDRYELFLDVETKEGQTVRPALHLDNSTDPPTETKGTWRPTENGVEIELRGGGTLSLIRLPDMGPYELMASGEDAPISQVWFQENLPEPEDEGYR